MKEISRTVGYALLISCCVFTTSGFVVQPNSLSLSSFASSASSFASSSSSTRLALRSRYALPEKTAADVADCRGGAKTALRMSDEYLSRKQRTKMKKQQKQELQKEQQEKRLQADVLLDEM
eukprot:760335-Hanusia_phi.AAC.1